MAPLPLLSAVSLALRAGRRSHGLSQRDLAAAACLSQATVARLERSYPGVALPAVRQALAVVGLRLAVVHQDGSPWREEEALQVDALGVVDRGGRRFPAHLPEDVETSEPYCRRFRDERAGYVRPTAWTFRRTTVEDFEWFQRLTGRAGPPVF